MKNIAWRWCVLELARIAYLAGITVLFAHSMLSALWLVGQIEPSILFRFRPPEPLLSTWAAAMNTMNNPVEAHLLFILAPGAMLVVLAFMEDRS